jgi:hypothetical protein
MRASAPFLVASARGVVTVDHWALKLTLLAAAPAVFDLSRELAGVGVAALVLLPMIAISVARRQLLVVDPIIVLGLMWISAVSLPVLLPGLYENSPWYVTPQSADLAAIWMYRAWAGMTVAYWAARVFFRVRHRLPAPRELALEDRMRVLVGVVGFTASATFTIMTGGQSYTHLDLGRSTSTAQQIVHELQQFAAAYVFLYFYARGKSRLVPHEGCLLLALLSGQVLLFTASATKLAALQLLAAWLLGYAAGKKRSNLARELGIGVVLLVVTYFVFDLVTAYRIEIKSHGANPNAPFADAISLQLDAIQAAVADVIEGKELGDENDPYDARSMLDRLAHVKSFGMLLDYVNGYSPYENAYASLIAPIYSLLPRDLISEKVQFFGSGDFARMNGWEFGGLSLSTPGSLFWAWGFEGIVPGMMTLGLILGLLSRGAEKDGPFGLIWRVLAVRMILDLLDLGIEFQPFLISLNRSFLFLLVFLMLAMAGWPPPARRAL